VILGDSIVMNLGILRNILLYSFVMLLQASCMESRVDVSIVQKDTIKKNDLSLAKGTSLQTSNKIAGFDEKLGFDILEGTDTGLFISDEQLTVTDLTDSSNPIDLSFFTFIGGTKVKIINSKRAYVFGLEFVSLINIENLEDIKLISTYDFAGGTKAQDFVFGGEYVYVSLLSDGFSILSFSNEENPILVKSQATVGDSIGIHIDGNELFTSDDTILVVYDITNPLLINELGRFDTTDNKILDIKNHENKIFALTNGTLHTLNGTDYSSISSYSAHSSSNSKQIINYENNVFAITNSAFFGGLTIQNIDLNIPGTPNAVGESSFPPALDFSTTNDFDIILRNNKIFLQSTTSDLYVFDLFPLTGVNKQSVNLNSLNGGITEMKFSGTTGVSLGVDGVLSTTDFTNPDKPTITGQHFFSVFANSIIIHNGYAFIKTWDFNAAVKVFDLNDLDTPVGSVTLTSAKSAHGPISHKGNIFYVPNEDRFHVIDMANPLIPNILSTVSSGYWTLGSIVEGDYLYVMHNTDEIKVYDISTPSTPTFVNNFGTSSGIKGVINNSMYVSDYSSIVEIYDLGTPSLPTLVGNIPTIKSSTFASKGSFFYTFDELTNKLHIYDVSNPATPNLVSSTIAIEDVLHIEIIGDILFVSLKTRSFLVDISDNTQPVVL
jgi:hypothetical protein